MLIDANIILRILLRDNEEMAKSSLDLILSRQVIVRYEVVAEVVFVLQKVYDYSRTELSKKLLKFISIKNVRVDFPDVLHLALITFAEKNIDFVDCILYAFNAIEKYEVFSFDKKLNKLLKS